MSNYVLILSRNRLESTAASRCLDLATDLRAGGHSVTVFLVQNGVFVGADELSDAVDGGVRVVADGFSLRERGLAQSQLHDAVGVASLDLIIDRLVAGDKVVWH